MRIAVGDLTLDHLGVIHPGEQRMRLADKVTALPLGSVMELERPEPG